MVRNNMLRFDGKIQSKRDNTIEWSLQEPERRTGKIVAYTQMVVFGKDGTVMLNWIIYR